MQIQHPSLYSPEGLAGAKQLLVEFVERRTSPAQVRQRNRARLDSGQRRWKVSGTPSRHGAYAPAIQWCLTIADVAAGGPEQYCDNVRAWARSMLATLKRSANFDSGPLDARQA